MKIAMYQVLAVAGSALLMGSGLLKYLNSGSPKELFIAIFYFAANVIIFCL